jgi:hypothetical protein
MRKRCLVCVPGWLVRHGLFTWPKSIEPESDIVKSKLLMDCWSPMGLGGEESEDRDKTRPLLKGGCWVAGSKARFSFGISHQRR